MSARRILNAGALALGVLLNAAAVFAQPPPAGPRLEVTAGTVWALSMKLATNDASEKAPDGGPLTLFRVSGTESAKAGVDLTIGLRLTRQLWAEVSGSVLKPEFRTSVSGDFEDIAPVTLALPMTRYSAEGAAVWMLRSTGRLQPFVRGGAGWMREISNDKVLVQDTVVSVVGGGIKYWLRQRDTGHFRRFGLRAEARAVDRLGDLSFGVRRISGAIFGGAIFGF